MLSSQIITQCTTICSQFHPVHLSIHTQPFTIPYIYILKISKYGMRDFNRSVCNRYKARSVEVMVSQYLKAHSKKKSKDTSSSWTLFTLETSGWIVIQNCWTCNGSSRLQPVSNVLVAIPLVTIWLHMYIQWHTKFHIAS